MKISHETPISLLPYSTEFNDYDYALVHLFEEYPKYFQFFEKSLASGRTVILDNSIFELGKAFDSDRFAYWVEKLKPTEYIIPDALEDRRTTLYQAEEWVKKYPNLPGKKIGVVQGESIEEIKYCYRRLVELGVDKIAISFDYSLYNEIFPHPNKIVSWCFGRVRLINLLLESGTINRNIPHHLLGCSSPIEFSLYRDSRYSFLESLDTSSPIVRSLLNQKYEIPEMLFTKPSIKLFQLIEHTVTPDQYKLVRENVSQFRNFVK